MPTNAHQGPTAESGSLSDAELVALGDEQLERIARGDSAASRVAAYALAMRYKSSQPGEVRRWLELSASEEYPRALYALARRCLKGSDGYKDGPRAIRLLEQAVSQHHRKSEFLLGRCWWKGEGVPQKDPERGVQLMRCAANSGLELACLFMGIACDRGRGVQQSYEDAREWFTKAASTRDGAVEHVRVALFNLGAYAFKGRGTNAGPDEAAAMDYWGRSAELNYPRAKALLGRHLVSKPSLGERRKGFQYLVESSPEVPSAMFDLGKCYAEGIPNPPIDPIAAATCFRKAARVRYMRAILAWGQCFYHGRGEPQNFKKARKCFEIAANEGRLSGAFLNLGLCHTLGQGGLDPDPKRGAALFEQAAELGDYRARHHLGLYHYACKDYDAAVKQFTLASAENFPAAQSALGLCYFRGEGVDAVNVHEAARLFHLAAMQKDPCGQYYWGVCLRDGVGVDRANSDEGLAMIRSAAEQGYELAEEALQAPQQSPQTEATYSTIPGALSTATYDEIPRWGVDLAELEIGQE